MKIRETSSREVLSDSRACALNMERRHRKGSLIREEMGKGCPHMVPQPSLFTVTITGPALYFLLGFKAKHRKLWHFGYRQ